MEVEIDYTPRDEAVDRFHDRAERVCYWIAHRRRGKTVAIANDGLKRVSEIPIKGREHAPPKIAWMYPTRVRAKDIAWSYLKFYARKIPGTRAIESELAIEFSDGRRFTLYGADGHRGVGQYLDGIYYDERDDIPDGVVVDLAPTLSDYHGFSVHAGMLRGRHRLWKLRQESKGNPEVLNIMEKASETHVIPDDELALLKIEMGESAYALQMECDPNAALAHAIYGEWMEKARAEGRVCKIPWETSVPVEWFADIGHSLRGDDWSWWAVQMKGRDILLQRYFSNTNKAPSWYAAEIHKWTEEAGCPMGCVFLPHDGSAQDRNGRSAKDDLMTAGIARCKVVDRTPNLWNSINDVRDTFGRFWIDEARCDLDTKVGTLPDGSPWTLPSGLDCLDLYTKKERTDGIPGEEPDHNAYSHGCVLKGTIITTDSGCKPVECIKAGDYVATPKGRARVNAATLTGMRTDLVEVTWSDGSLLICTPEHPIFTNDGLTRADELRILAEAWTQETSPNPWFLTALGIGYRAATTSRLLAPVISIATFIGRCGRLLMGASKLDITYTTSTATLLTTGLKTSPAYGPSPISAPTQGRASGTLQEKMSKCSSIWQYPQARRGIVPQQVGNGTGSTALMSGQNDSLSLEIVSIVGRHSSPRFIISFSAEDFASSGLIMDRCQRWIRSALSVVLPLWTKANAMWQNTARKNANGKWVVSIEELELRDPVPVYDLTVEGDHCYFANGVLVSNCDALRTFIEAFKAGMLDGTSAVAQASRRGGPDRPRVLRGPGPGSYPLGYAKWGQRRETIRR